jgi:saccharopine dehydrogenase-like NADP-dependent oxidoreductase
MINDKILIVGGYGAVGRTITVTMANRFPDKIIVAGRSYQKAKALAVELNNTVRPIKLDLASLPDLDELLKDVGVVIMCIDQPDIQFIRKCIQRGIHFIDITATHELIAEIETLQNEAKTSNSTVVLSVGVAPGLSNLLAKHCKNRLPNLRYINIFILLGLGEAHGEAAMRWTLDRLNPQFFLKEFGKLRMVKSFEDGKVALLPNKVGKRIAYRFNISDQHAIIKNLDIDSVSTRICFDSRAITRLYAGLKKLGISKLFKARIVQDFIIRLLRAIRYGSDQFVVKVEAGIDPRQEPQFECSIYGNQEARITALVASKVAEYIYATSSDPGVFHIDQLFDPIEFIESLNNYGLRFEEGMINEM